MSVLSGSGDPTNPGANRRRPTQHRIHLHAPGLGDIILHPKLRLLNATRNGLGIAIIPSIVLPTGDKNAFLGEGQTIFQPTVVIDAEVGYLGRFRATINAGMRLRKDATFIDDGATYTNPRTFTGRMTNTRKGILVVTR